MLKLLFIKLKHIGDVLLLTPTLDAVRECYPEARIDVLVRQGTEGILTGCPAIDRVFTTVSPEMENRQDSGWRMNLNLINQLRRQKYDYVFLVSPEDRSCFYSILVRAKARVINPFEITGVGRWMHLFFAHDESQNFLGMHTVERDYALARKVLDLPQTPPPLSFSSGESKPNPEPDQSSETETTVVIHPTTRWKVKEWPEKYWLELIGYLLNRFDRVIISVGPAENEIAVGERLCREFNQGVTCTEGRWNWKELAFIFQTSDLFIGVDTAAMHLAAACKIPLIALFGHSRECYWQPWTDSPYRVLRDTDYNTDQPVEVLHFEDGKVDRIGVDQVQAAIEELMVN